MGTVAQTAALLAAVVAAAALFAVAVGLHRATRSTRAHRERLDRELLTSRDEVARLSRQVAELSDEVTEARREAEADRDHVITSLAHAGGAEDAGDGAGLPLLPDGDHGRPAVGEVVEEQLVGVLARHQGGSRLRARAVDLVVHTVALGHGVRRALSPDVLDRAAAEAHVARRRSRRVRRRELREARRLVRGTREAGSDDGSDAGPGPRRRPREDAA